MHVNLVTALDLVDGKIYRKTPYHFSIDIFYSTNLPLYV
jgi:hypothetical protein